MEGQTERQRGRWRHKQIESETNGETNR
jgi:hypothetical protein